MKITQERHGAVTIVKASGALVRDEVEPLRRAIDEAVSASLGRCVLDVTEMPFLDSAGIEALLDAADGLARAGQALRLCGSNETVREILDLTGTAGHFDFFQDVNTAVRSFL